MKARGLATLALAGVLTVPGFVGCRREDAAAPDQMKAQIEALAKERTELRAKLGNLVANDRRLAGMPENGVRVGVPTPLVRTLVQRVMAGFVDSVTLKLKNLKSGTVGSAASKSWITVALPVQVASGTGDATIDFKWDGKNISGAVCGDMDIHQKVSGSVKPDSYPV